MSESNYVLAGMETLLTYFSNFCTKNKQGNWDNHYTPEQHANLLKTCCLGFLHSFGQNFTGKKNYKNYVDNEAKAFQDCRDSGIYEDSPMVVDSGGFQASTGKINENETELLIELYHEFLVKHIDVYDRAFILDIPPGPGCKIFDNFDQVYDYNNKTYNLAKNLPQKAKDKIIYIHHFRTPKLWEIYTDILNQPGMFESFKSYGTGGIVANMSGDTMPYIIYVLPLIPILKKTIEAGRKELSFHILGGATYRDVFFYEIFQKIVKEEHDVDLTMSYDSSGPFKGLLRGRTMHLLHEDIVYKTDMRSHAIRNRLHGNYRTIDIIREKVNNMADRFGFKRIDMKELYCDKVNSFPDYTRSYLVLLTLVEFAQVQMMLKQKAHEIYPIYQAGDLEEFARQCSQVTQNINSGKITRKQKSKTNSLINSVEMLINLDEEHCKYIVNKYLAKDEFTELDKKTRVLTI